MKEQIQLGIKQPTKQKQTRKIKHQRITLMCEISPENKNKTQKKKPIKESYKTSKKRKKRKKLPVESRGAARRARDPFKDKKKINGEVLAKVELEAE